jgi:hypothetical protein
MPLNPEIRFNRSCSDASFRFNCGEALWYAALVTALSLVTCRVAEAML